MEKYRFNKEKHLHEINVNGEWKALTGCTTILKVLAKPALIQWAANMAVEYVRDNLKKIEDLEEVLGEAKTAHRKRKEKAGEYGTKTHEEIEKMINYAIEKNGGLVDGHLVNEDKSIHNFVQWAMDNNIKFLQSEKNVYSEKLFLGGIVDFICEIDGEVWIGDIKTSKSGIYPEHFAQIAGYQLMVQEMGLYPEIKGYVVINLKESGEMLEKRSVSNGDNTKFFLSCLEIYRQQEKLKNNII